MPDFSRPVFIVSAPRSGSTLFRLILDAHPRLAVPSPAWLYEMVYPYLYSYGDLASPENLTALAEDIFENPFIKNMKLDITPRRPRFRLQSSPPSGGFTTRFTATTPSERARSGGARNLPAIRSGWRRSRTTSRMRSSSTSCATGATWRSTSPTRPRCCPRTYIRAPTSGRISRAPRTRRENAWGNRITTSSVMRICARSLRGSLKNCANSWVKISTDRCWPTTRRNLPRAGAPFPTT